MPQIIQLIEKDEDEIIVSDKVACYIVAAELSVKKIQAAAAVGKMVLCQGNNALDMCRLHNLDGIVAKVDVSKPLKAQVKPLREALKKKTLGVIVPARRHEAMLAGEVEPDFIAFYSSAAEHDADFLSWYDELFLIPSAWVASGSETAVPETDFVIADAKKIKNFGC